MFAGQTQTDKPVDKPDEVKAVKTDRPLHPDGVAVSVEKDYVEEWTAETIEKVIYGKRFDAKGKVIEKVTDLEKRLKLNKSESECEELDQRHTFKLKFVYRRIPLRLAFIQHSTQSTYYKLWYNNYATVWSEDGIGKMKKSITVEVGVDILDKQKGKGKAKKIGIADVLAEVGQVAIRGADIEKAKQLHLDCLESKLEYKDAIEQLQAL